MQGVNIKEEAGIKFKFKEIGILSIFLSVFSGKFSLGRFLHNPFFDSFEIKYLFLFIASVSAIVLIFNDKKNFRARFQTYKFLSLPLSFYVLMLINIFTQGSQGMRGTYIAESVEVIIGLFLVAIIFQHEKDVKIFAFIAETIGVILFFLAIFKIGYNELNGAGWTVPYAGPITFYKIEFFTFTSAVYLFVKTNRNYKFLHLFIAAIGLFSTFASLSKAAFLGAMLVVLFYFILLLVERQYKIILILFLLVSTTVSGFSFLKGRLFISRIANVINLNTNATTLQSSEDDDRVQKNLKWILDIGQSIEAGKVKYFRDLSVDSQRKILSIVNVNHWPASTKEEIINNLNNPEDRSNQLSRLLPYLLHTVVIQDSGRILLIMHAWDLFKYNKLFGVGIGNYSFNDINMYTSQEEKYKYPHNLIFEIAASMGAIGLIIFGFAFLGSVVMMLQILKSNLKILFIIGYPIFIFITSQFTGDLYDSRLLWYVIIMILITHQGFEPKKELYE